MLARWTRRATNTAHINGWTERQWSLHLWTGQFEWSDKSRTRRNSIYGKQVEELVAIRKSAKAA